MVGIVKSWSRLKGYGFLICKEIDHDIFVHYSDIVENGFKCLNIGEIVYFDYDEIERKAIHVKKNTNRAIK